MEILGASPGEELAPFLLAEAAIFHPCQGAIAGSGKGLRTHQLSFSCMSSVLTGLDDDPYVAAVFRNSLAARVPRSSLPPRCKWRPLSSGFYPDDGSSFRTAFVGCTAQTVGAIVPCQEGDNVLDACATGATSPHARLQHCQVTALLSPLARCILRITLGAQYPLIKESPYMIQRSLTGCIKTGVLRSVSNYPRSSSGRRH